MTRAGALVVGLVLIAAACSSGGDDKVASSSTTTTTLAPPVAPLTGVADPSGVAQGRAALMFKLGNTPRARPQSGIAVADVVYEEVVEGGITRLLVVFNSETPDPVGGIRSVRPVDAVLAEPIGGVFAYSGGIPSEVSRIQSVPGLITVNEDSAGDAMFRDTDRRSPHNLFALAPALWDLGGEPIPPAPLFEYLGEGETFAGEPITSFTVGLSSEGDYNPTYTWDPAAGGWLRSLLGQPAPAASGAPVVPANVIIQFTTYDPSPGADGAVGQVIGTGEAWVFSAGGLVRGTWSRTDPTAPARYFDAAGLPIKLTPGKTWVSLAAFGANTQLVAPTP